MVDASSRPAYNMARMSVGTICVCVFLVCVHVPGLVCEWVCIRMVVGRWKRIKREYGCLA